MVKFSYLISLKKFFHRQMFAKSVISPKTTCTLFDLKKLSISLVSGYIGFRNTKSFDFALKIFLILISPEAIMVL